MTVIETNKWLDRYTKKKKRTFSQNMDIQRKLFCGHLMDYFEDATTDDIHLHLLNHGLFIPDPLDKQVIQGMFEKDYWKIAKIEISKLLQAWDGPEVPVFLFPSNYTNKPLMREFNGIAGLSYHNKIFLFITNRTEKNELRALLTHEYNHSCRLIALNKGQDELNLLDALILEGLAETAVKQRLGSKHLNKWTTIYSKEQMEQFWKKWIKPNLEIKKMSRQHDQLMYGHGNIPKWLGYCCGYYIVSSYFEKKDISMYDALRIPSATILKESNF
ncbi:DUF2268 domain-containing protein [Aquibacillus koreensis]|uniref:DUF2268 domain-containing protein n=1 Tax=Aquibacillus koreensis TaxID=279446 RepID=A0A9X4AII6_9BACI|nr:DUF2268 domain-containing protein [Aquibacillus koreensis]MCT2537775.1 DUF2268 domain-containing protein [Aquibacillus koreensis]MDC3421192.1 DUF2268 domain-containing protein [Aquibacillus koreensis]